MADPGAGWDPGRATVRADALEVRKEKEAFAEPIFWGLFSLGGFLTAFLLPVTVVLLFLAAPLGLWPAERVAYEAFAARFGDPLVRLFFFLLIAGSLFHGAHRLKHGLVDAGLKRIQPLLDLVLYGIAALGSLAALYYTFGYAFVDVPFL